VLFLKAKFSTSIQIQLTGNTSSGREKCSGRVTSSPLETEPNVLQYGDWDQFSMK